MEDKKMEIAKIVVRMGNTESTLTVGEAKKLFKLLEEMFGEKVVKEYISYPVYRDRPSWVWRDNVVYCGSAGKVEYADNTVYCSVT